MTAGSIEGAGTFSLGSNQLTVGSNNLSTTVSGIIRGTAGSLVKVGTGTLTLSGVNTYTGATTVNAGALSVDGSLSSSSVTTVNSGATLGGSGTVSAALINNGATLAPGPTGAPGTMTVAGNLTFESAAAYLVQVSPTSATSLFVTDATTIAGTLTANAVGGSYTANQIYPLLISTGPLTGAFNLATTGNFAGATVSLAYSSNEVFLVINGSAGAGPIAWKAAPGTSDWNTGTNWTTNTVPTATDIAQFNASTITTIDIRQPNTQVGGLQFNVGAPAYTFNITGSASGASSLIVSGSGVADISGNAPTFVVSGIPGAPGTLRFTNSSTAGDATIITNAFGQTIFSGTSNGGVARFVTNVGGVVDFSGTSGLAGRNIVTAGSIEGAGTYNLGANLLVVGINGLSTTVSGTINDGGASGGAGGSLVKVGRGTLTLSGSSTYTGPTVILGGTLQAGATNALAANSAFSIGSRQMLDLASFNQTIGSLAGAGDVTLGSATLTTGNDNTSTTFSGSISGSGGLTKIGAGTLTLSGNNSYSGGTAINGGTLAVSTDDNLGRRSGGLAFDGGTLQVVPRFFFSTFSTNRDITLNAGGGTVDTNGNDATLAGTIAGLGALAKIGDGTLTLSGNNTYSGGTAINGGTLAVSTDSNLGNSSGGLAFNFGTLQIASGLLSTFTSNRAITLNGVGTIDTNRNDATLGGTISGPGSLIKVGAGTLTVSGSNIYTGATVVAGGTLSLTGDISPSSGVFVGPNATLAGTGTAPGVLVAGGTLMPGTSVGTLNVRGSLVFTSAATYLININATTSSLTNVSGTATLAGATVQVVDDRNITKRQVYTLLTATGGISGTFNPDVVGVKNKVELFYNANNVFLCDHCKVSDLIAQQFSVPGSPSTPALAPTNVSQVAAAIDAAIDADVAVPTRFLNLLGLSREQVVTALTQLTGEVHTGAEQAGFQVMDRFLRLMLDPFAETRGAGGGGSAMGFAPERSAALPPDVALAYASVLKEPAASRQLAAVDRPWNIWAAGYGGRANISGDPNGVGSHDNSVRDYGYAAGLDYRVAPDTTVGFALGGAGTDWSITNALGTGRSDVFQGGLYGSKRWGPVYVSAALAYSSYWMSTDRFVNVFGTDHLTSNFVAHNFGGRLESGYRLAMPEVAVTPYAAFQAQRLYLPGYSESAPSGSVFALTYNAQSLATTRSELGAWFDRTVLVAEAYAATVFARAAWAHDWGNDRALNTNFLALPTSAFIIDGAALPPDKALVTAGSELRIRNGWSVTGKFDGEFANRLQTYAGTGVVRYVW
jgi:autotransporter-associated beta strand protein